MFIICRGRLLHGRHFTYKSINGDTAITFVSTGVEGAFATEEHPYAAHGPWLQVLTHLWSKFSLKFLCSDAFNWANHSPCVDIIDWRVCGADAWGYTRTVHSWRGQWKAIAIYRLFCLFFTDLFWNLHPLCLCRQSCQKSTVGQKRSWRFLSYQTLCLIIHCNETLKKKT